MKTIDGQLSLFDFLSIDLEELPDSSIEDIPMPDENNMIPAGKLKALEWEAWDYFNLNLTLNDGPYEIKAFLAILPGNRLYVKGWMRYPFMYQFANEKQLRKAYETERKLIAEWKFIENSEREGLFQIDRMPLMEDMYEFQENEFGCFDYCKNQNYIKHLVQSMKF